MNVMELNYVIKEINNKYRNKWEQVRWVGFTTFRAMTGTPNKPSELLPFSWDEINSKDSKNNAPVIDLKKSATELGNFLDKIKNKK